MSTKISFQRTLGRSNLSVSAMGLGCWAIGGPWFWLDGQGGWGDATSAASSLYGSSADGKVSPGTCGVNCSNDYGLYAFHSGGANAVFADGSVRFVPASTDVRLLIAAITKNGGEVAAANF